MVRKFLRRIVLHQIYLDHSLRDIRTPQFSLCNSLQEELLDVIEDLKLALDWSKERERCLQHQLNLERTMRMELVRSREDLEGSRPVSGMRTSLSKQQDSHRFQVSQYIHDRISIGPFKSATT